MRRRWLAAGIAAGLVLGAAIVATRPPSGDRSLRSFEATRLADLELRMWQAYYGGQRVQLFGLLVLTLREQYHCSWATASRAAFRFARAAATFAGRRDSYEVVIPDLVAGYQSVNVASGRAFDADTVARTALAWWVARRVPGQNAPEQVGELIAREYAAVYGTTVDEMRAAGVLRARAAARRDAQADGPDWTEIEALLKSSYQELQRALRS